MTNEVYAFYISCNNHILYFQNFLRQRNLEKAPQFASGVRLMPSFNITFYGETLYLFILMLRFIPAFILFQLTCKAL